MSPIPVERKPWLRLGDRLGFAASKTLVSGVLISVLIAFAATFIAEHYGGPTLLYALLIGMAFFFLSQEGRCAVGITFAASTILRFGVALLGGNIALDQILILGLGPIMTVVGAITVTVLSGWALASIMGLTRNFGLLSGGATAICGASAALALSATMPRTSESERDTLLVIIGVTTLSTLAMILYPLLVAVLDLNAAKAGIFLGGTIHDVAQVVGAAYMVSEETGDIATYTKLLRVCMLLPTTLLYALAFRQSRSVMGEVPPLIPGFLLGFAVLVALNSAGMIPDTVREGMADLSRWCLVTALAALGMRTSLKQLVVVGWRPVALMITETAVMAGAVLACLSWL